VATASDLHGFGPAPPPPQEEGGLLNPLLLLSTGVSLAAFGVTVALLVRVRDPRLALLGLLLGALVVGDGLALSGLSSAGLGGPTIGDGLAHAPALALMLSIIAFMAVFSLERMITDRRRAEVRLAESEERFRRLAAISPVGIFRANPQGECIYANKRACEIAGIPLEEAYGFGWAQSLHPDDRDRVIDTWREGAESGRRFAAEYRFLHADGRVVPVIGEVIPEHEASGAFVGLVGTLTDITDRKRAEQSLQRDRDELEREVSARTGRLAALNDDLQREVAMRREVEADLREREQHFRRVFEDSPLAMAMSGYDDKLIRVNARFCEMLGYQPDEVYGRSFLEFTHPDDVELSVAASVAILKGDSPTEVVEKRYRRKDGATVYARTTIALIRDESGAPMYRIGMIEDVSERIWSREERNRIFDMALDPMCIGGFDGRFKVVNPEFVKALGWSEDEILSKHFTDLVHPDDREAVLADNAAVLQGNPTPPVESRWLCKDGSYRWLSWHAWPVVERRTVYAVARDITDRKLMEDSMFRHKDQMAHVMRVQTMGEMTSQIAHELGQPLGAVVNYAEGALSRLRSGQLAQGEIESVLEKIAAQGLRAGNLIRGISEFVRKNRLELASVDVGQIAANAVTLVQAGSPEDVEIRLVRASDVPLIEADAVQLEQVIINLMRNGIDAMTAKPTGQRLLTVTTSAPDPEHVEVTVADTGVGIAPELVDKVFEAFYSTKGAGLGMGLAMSRTIVAAHGGRLWVTSEPGAGATFHLRIPVNAPA
jgi:PAS domain S-box-containing protein